MLWDEAKVSKEGICPWQMLYSEGQVTFPVYPSYGLYTVRHQPNFPLAHRGCYGRRFEGPPKGNILDSLTQIILFMIGWRIRRFYVTANWLDNATTSQTYLNLHFRVRLFSLPCIYVTCFSIHCANGITLSVDIYSKTERCTYIESMSKDNRHDGRRRGAGQHRVGPRVTQGGDGRERSGSNSSGSSHGGGKSKNTPITALKV